METSYFGSAGVLLVKAVFGFFVTVVLLRFLLQWARADFYNPLSQFVVKVTNPMLVPLRRVIPGVGGVDVAAVVLMFALQLLETWLLTLLMGVGVNLASMAVLSLARLIDLAFTIYTVTIIAEAILSWFQQGSHNPMIALLHQLNQPVLNPVRRIIPTFSGIDLSPLVALVLLQLASILIVGPLHDLARSLSLG